MSIEGSITFLYSQDISMSLQFYEKDLGLQRVHEKEGVIFFKVPGTAASHIGIVPEGTSAASASPVSCCTAAGRDTVMLCLLTSNVDAVYDKVLAGGHVTEVCITPRDNPKYAIRHALLRSPEGYLVELQTFSDDDVHTLFVT